MRQDNGKEKNETPIPAGATKDEFSELTVNPDWPLQQTSYTDLAENPGQRREEILARIKELSEGDEISAESAEELLVLTKRLAQEEVLPSEVAEFLIRDSECELPEMDWNDYLENHADPKTLTEVFVERYHDETLEFVDSVQRFREWIERGDPTRIAVLFSVGESAKRCVDALRKAITSQNILCTKAAETLIAEEPRKLLVRVNACIMQSEEYRTQLVKTLRAVIENDSYRERDDKWEIKAAFKDAIKLGDLMTEAQEDEDDTN